MVPTRSVNKNRTRVVRRHTDKVYNHTERNHKSCSHTNTGQCGAPANAKSTSVADTDTIKLSQRKTVQTTPTSRPSTEDKESPNKQIPTTYLWKKNSEAINTLKATATHKLTATSLSLSERDGIGDFNKPPALTDQTGASGFFP